MKTTLTLLTALLATPTWAQTSTEGAANSTATTTASTPDRPVAVPVGTATRSLLQRQRSGAEASAAPRPISGEVADLSHQRYLKSFEQPLPAWFGSHLEPQSK